MAAPELAVEPRRPAWHYWIAFVATVMAVGALIAFSYAITGVGKARPGFLGTNARFLADLNLVMQIAMAVVLLIGFFIIRRGNMRAHKLNQTIVVLTNLVLIIFVMVTTLVSQVLPESSAAGESRVYLPMIHGLMGLVAELLGIYLVLRMNNLIPKRWKVKNFKGLMRFTLTLWLLTAAFGVWVYTTLYAPTSAVAVAPASVAVPQGPPAATVVQQATATVVAAMAMGGYDEYGASQPATTETRLGSVAIRDNFAYGDQVFVNLANLPAPTPGQVYAGWLTGANGQLRRPIGQISVSPDGKAQFGFDSAKGENFMAQYDGFFLTLEPEKIPDAPSGPVVARAQVPPNAMAAIRRLMVSFPNTPDAVGLNVGLREQTEELLRHAQFARDAARVNDLASLKRHTEHMVLLLEGKKGADYKDLDGDGQALDPGDGFGLLSYGDQPGYLKSVADQARAAAEANDATDLVKLHSGHVQIATENIKGWVTQLRDIGLTIFAAKDVASTGNKAQQMVVLADRALNGFDANGNEIVEPIPGEAGTKLAYQHGQFMAEMPLSMQSVQAAKPAPTVVVAAVPTLIPEPTAKPTLPPPAPGAISLPMVNFAFVPKDITVKVGTTITFVNQDKAPHTATGDKKEFDTGIIGGNKSGQITFKQAGTFSYYCELHGGPGGQGMAGTIIVQP